MKVGIIGHGKMGKTIEKILKDRNHVISCIVDPTNNTKLEDLKKTGTDVAIEFTSPAAAFENISSCIEMGIPVVSGSTGWLDDLPQIKKLLAVKNGAFFYASNFSLGVNLFFKLNKVLAEMMSNFDNYTAGMEEIHHTQKLDKPSGTAITLAEGLIEKHKSYSGWLLEKSEKSKIRIDAIREPEVHGTHTVFYQSEQDIIEIKHTAKGREGFAMGAVMAAEWLPGKSGFLTMDDYLKI